LTGVTGSAARKIEVRPVDADERAAWEPSWKRYQAFYKVALPEDTTEVTWRRLQDPAEPMFALGAYVDGRLVGIVHYLFHRSTWAVGGYCYLQDLFTDEGSRGLGIGRALIEAVYAEAKKPASGVSIGIRTRRTFPRARSTTRWPTTPVSFSIARASDST
jgi:GNAT superfamily N-acetyltransferase